jgi:hypothetical protein
VLGQVVWVVVAELWEVAALLVLTAAEHPAFMVAAALDLLLQV